MRKYVWFWLVIAFFALPISFAHAATTTVSIVSPVMGAHISQSIGQLPIVVTAQNVDLNERFYITYSNLTEGMIPPNFGLVEHHLFGVQKPITSGQLFSWDISGLSDGSYAINLYYEDDPSSPGYFHKTTTYINIFRNVPVPRSYLGPVVPITYQPLFPGDGAQPVISGNYAVALSYTPGTSYSSFDFENFNDPRKFSLSLYDLSQPGSAPVRITSDAAFPDTPAISGNNIVWVDYRNGAQDIYMCVYNPTTHACPEKRVTSSGRFEEQPQVSNRGIVWQSYSYDAATDDYSDYDVEFYDFYTYTIKKIASSARDEHDPQISEGFIAWVVDIDEDTSAIWYYNLDATKPIAKQVIKSSDLDDVFVNFETFALHGSRLVWYQSDFNADSPEEIVIADLMAPNISASAQIIYADDYGPLSVFIDQNHIVWDEAVGDLDTSNSDLFQYDFSTGTVSPLTAVPGNQYLWGINSFGALIEDDPFPMVNYFHFTPGFSPIVPPPPPATLDLQVAPTSNPAAFSDGPVSIYQGESVILKWTSSNVSGCSAWGSQGISSQFQGAEPSSGTQTVGPLSGSAITFTLTCFDARGNAVMDDVAITTTPPPLKIVPNPLIVSDLVASSSNQLLGELSFQSALGEPFKVGQLVLRIQVNGGSFSNLRNLTLWQIDNGTIATPSLISLDSSASSSYIVKFSSFTLPTSSVVGIYGDITRAMPTGTIITLSTNPSLWSGVQGVNSGSLIYPSPNSEFTILSQQVTQVIPYVPPPPPPLSIVSPRSQSLALIPGVSSQLIAGFQMRNTTGEAVVVSQPVLVLGLSAGSIADLSNLELLNLTSGETLSPVVTPYTGITIPSSTSKAYFLTFPSFQLEAGSSTLKLYANVLRSAVNTARIQVAIDPSKWGTALGVLTKQSYPISPSSSITIASQYVVIPSPSMMPSVDIKAATSSANLFTDTLSVYPDTPFSLSFSSLNIIPASCLISGHAVSPHRGQANGMITVSGIKKPTVLRFSCEIANEGHVVDSIKVGVIPSFPPPRPGNLAPNASFESDLYSTGYFPEINDTSFVVTRDGNDAHTGSSSVAASFSLPSGISGIPWGMRPGTVSVFPGQMYRVSAWIKTDAVNGSSTLIVNFAATTTIPSLGFVQVGGDINAPLALSGKNGWTKVEVTAIAPKRAQYITPKILVAGVGTVHVDDLDIEEGPEILTNNNFTQGQTAWSGWTSKTLAVPYSQLSTATPRTTKRLNKNISGASKILKIYYGKRPKALRHQIIKVSPGDTFDLGASIKGLGYIEAQWKNNTGALVWRDLLIPRTFSQESVVQKKIVAPANASRLVVKLIARRYTKGFVSFRNIDLHRQASSPP